MNTVLILFVFGAVINQGYGCPETECDLPASMRDRLQNYVRLGFDKSSDYCTVANYVRGRLETVDNKVSWIVLIGGNYILTSREEFGLATQRVIKTSYRYRYMDTHDVEVFAVEKNTQLPQDKLRFASRSKIGTFITVIDELTDMNDLRKENFEIASDKALVATSVFNEAAELIDGYITNRLCTGNWVYIVAAYGRLSRHNFCASFNKLQGNYFRGQWKRSPSTPLSHEILCFAPA